MGLKYGFYSYDKKRGLIPLDKSGNPLFKTKKAYKEFIDTILLPEMGLLNIKKTAFATYKKPLYCTLTNGSQYLYNYKTNYRPVKINTNEIMTTLEKYIYLDIDFTKVSLNEILKDFRIKKNSKAFVINYREFYGKFNQRDVSYGKISNKKILAIPVKEYYNFMNFKNNSIPKYKGAVKYFDKITNIFSYNVEIRTLPDNKLLQFYELLDYVKNRKPIEIYECIKVNPTLFNRKYQPKDDWLTYKLSDGKIIKYKEEWLIKGKTSIREVVNKSLKAFPCLIKQSGNIISKTGISELDQRNKEYLANLFKQFFCKFICKEAELTREDKNKLTKAIHSTFYYCVNHKKELIVNQKFISNQHLLTPLEKIYIQTYIIPKALELLKNTYKRQNYQKQFEFMIKQLAYEVISQIKYDELNQNKYVNQNTFNNLNLAEHIKHSVISNKWFNKFIAYLKDNYKHFNIKPNHNIKYKLLEALGLDINQEYTKQITCKTINNSIKDIFNVIKNNIKRFPYILSYRDNIINLYFKIYNRYNSLIEEFNKILTDFEKLKEKYKKKKEEYEEKERRKRPLNYLEIEFWSKQGIVIEPIYKKISEEDQFLIDLGFND